MLRSLFLGTLQHSSYAHVYLFSSNERPGYVAYSKQLLHIYAPDGVLYPKVKFYFSISRYSHQFSRTDWLFVRYLLYNKISCVTVKSVSHSQFQRASGAVQFWTEYSYCPTILQMQQQSENISPCILGAILSGAREWKTTENDN